MKNAKPIYAAIIAVCFSASAQAQMASTDDLLLPDDGLSLERRPRTVVCESQCDLDTHAIWNTPGYTHVEIRFPYFYNPVTPLGAYLGWSYPNPTNNQSPSNASQEACRVAAHNLCEAQYSAGIVEYTSRFCTKVRVNGGNIIMHPFMVSCR
jgi:hypothetical protein